ncbi:MAG: hypothetical protein KC561_00650, partial [Myxococcales bacterium]|nr:hypothetical protein [Myxococcales bacterium]
MEHSKISATLLFVGLLLGSHTALSQGFEWDEPVITLGPPPGGGLDNPIPSIEPDPTVQDWNTDLQGWEITSEEPGQMVNMVNVEDLPSPMDFDQVERLHDLAAHATIPVRVQLRQDQFRNTFGNNSQDGAATLVRMPDGRIRLVTASYLVQGVDSVFIETEFGPQSARVASDARFGMALLEPDIPIDSLGTPVELSDATAGTIEEAVSSATGTGATIGAGPDIYSYY